MPRKKTGEPTKKKGALHAHEAASMEQRGPTSQEGTAGRQEGVRERRSAMKVDDLMKEPQCCRTSDPVRDCARLMKTENIGFVPICNEAGEPLGTLTDRDLAIRIVAEGKSADTKADDVMTRDVVSCRVGDDLSEAERLMRERRKSRIMVCDSQRRLVGVISLSDIAEIEPEEVAARTLREVAAREAHQPHAS